MQEIAMRSDSENERLANALLSLSKLNGRPK